MSINQLFFSYRKFSESLIISHGFTLILLTSWLISQGTLSNKLCNNNDIRERGEGKERRERGGRQETKKRESPFVFSLRMPNLSLAPAIDVTTTGTYPRLPTCIRNRIIPRPPLTSTERESTFEMLEAVIRFRLSREHLPSTMMKVKNIGKFELL